MDWVAKAKSRQRRQHFRRLGPLLFSGLGICGYIAIVIGGRFIDKTENEMGSLWRIAQRARIECFNRMKAGRVFEKDFIKVRVCGPFRYPGTNVIVAFDDNLEPFDGYFRRIEDNKIFTLIAYAIPESEYFRPDFWEKLSTPSEKNAFILNLVYWSGINGIEPLLKDLATPFSPHYGRRIEFR